MRAGFFPQEHIVSLCLNNPDLVRVDEQYPSIRLDRDSIHLWRQVPEFRQHLRQGNHLLSLGSTGGSINGLMNSAAGKWLQHIVNGMLLKRFNGMFTVGGHKNNRGERVFSMFNTLGQFETRKFGHTN